MMERDLLEAIGGINNKFVNQADMIKPKQTRNIYFKWVAAVACLCLAVGGVIAVTNISSKHNRADAGGGLDGTVMPGGEMPDGIDSVMASIAVYPRGERSLEEVSDATYNRITEEEAYNFEGLGEHLPSIVIAGYHFSNAGLYETTMKDGMKYYLLRVEYTTGDENIADYSIQLYNYQIEDQVYIYTIDSITNETLQEGFFNVICGDIYVGMGSGDLSYDEIISVLRSIK